MPAMTERHCSMVLIVVALSLAVAGCGLNSNPPDYVKEFVAYKEGDGLVIYFVLADASGAPTTADGKVAMSIVEETYTPGKQVKTLFNTSFTLTRSQFVETTVGRGSFARTVVLCPLGRLRYSTFDAQPSDPGHGLIYMVFTTGAGSSFSEKTRVSF